MPKPELAMAAASSEVRVWSPEATAADGPATGAADRVGAQPQRPTVALSKSSDTGPFRDDGYTRDTTPTFEGRAGRGSTVVITRDRQIIAQGKASSSGKFSIKLPKLRDGLYRFEAAQVLEPGVGLFADEEIKVTIDTQAPSPPTVDQPPELIDKFVSIHGVTEDAGEVAVYFDGKPRYRAVARGDGSRWSTGIDPTTGIFQVSAILTDLAGNKSELSNTVTLIVSARAPELDLPAGGVASFDYMGMTTGGLFGYDVAAAGDFNGDDVADVIVGAPISDRIKKAETGSAFVLLGLTKRFFPSEFPMPYDDPRFSLHIFGGSTSRTLGAAVSSAGDMNGDGLSDILVGEPNSTGGNAYVVFGRRKNPGIVDVSKLDGTDGFRLTGDTDRRIGGALAGGGDVNGDGYDDIVIAPGDLGRLNGRQQVFVIFGRESGFPPVIDLALLGSQDGVKLLGDGPHFGFSVSNASDLDGDGFEDVVVTAPAFSKSDGRVAGEAFVIYGREQFGETINLRKLERAEGFAISGLQHEPGISSSIGGVSTGGDVNGDKIDDLVLSTAFLGIEARSSIGHVIFGTNKRRSGDLALADLGVDDGFGIELTRKGVAPMLSPSLVSMDEASIAPDLNSDGIDDLVVGTPGYLARTGFGGNGRSTAFIVFGRKKPWVPFLHLVALKRGEGFRIVAALYEETGYSIAGVGSFDKDDLGDVFIGAPIRKSRFSDDNGRLYGIFSSTRW